MAAMLALEPTMLRCLEALFSGTAAAAATAPAVCAGALAFWRWLDLPEVNGKAARVSRKIWHAIYASLVLLGLCAPFSGTVIRVAFLVQAILAASPWLYSLVGLSTRRAIHNCVVLGPLAWRYVAIDNWAKGTLMKTADREKHEEALHEKYAPEVFKLMVQQGGLYVKFGQLLSIFPDGVFPKAYMAQFRRMQGEVTALPIERIRAVLRRELGRPLEEVFSSFEDKPIGTASIGQVHRAVLASDGSDVVVKVQHPGMADVAWADYWSLKVLATTLVSEFKPILKHFKDWVRKELDFKEEASVIGRVHNNLREPFPKVIVPKPVKELCTREVVVMSFVPGISLLQAILRMATVVLGERGKQALQGLMSEEGELEEEGSAAASRAVNSVTSLGIVATTLASAILAWRRRRAVLRNLRRVVLASGAAAVLAAAALRVRQPSRRGALAPQTVLPSRAFLVRLLQHAVASSRSATNVGISLWNRTAPLVGLPRLAYRKEIPKFDPVSVATEIWKVQGHQFFVDGLFNSDAHPGNFLIDEKTGCVGLLDFGQACEPSIRLRVLIARLVVALAGTDEREIALRFAQLGFRSKRMTVAYLAAFARIKFGHMTLAGLEGMIRHLERLKKWDPIAEEPSDSDWLLLDRMVALLRGTTAMLGASLDIVCPPIQWLPFARACLAKYDSEVEDEDFELDDSLPEPEMKGGWAIG